MQSAHRPPRQAPLIRKGHPGPLIIEQAAFEAALSPLLPLFPHMHASFHSRMHLAHTPTSMPPPTHTHTHMHAASGVCAPPRRYLVKLYGLVRLPLSTLLPATPPGTLSPSLEALGSCYTAVQVGRPWAVGPAGVHGSRCACLTARVQAACLIGGPVQLSHRCRWR